MNPRAKTALMPLAGAARVWLVDAPVDPALPDSMSTFLAPLVSRMNSRAPSATWPTSRYPARAGCASSAPSTT